METLNFQRLFEVRLLHEFYLSDREMGGALFFDRSAAERQAMLPELLLQRRFDLRNHLTFEPTPATLTLLKQHRLRFWQNATGFVVASQVNRVENGRFRPTIPVVIPTRAAFYIRMKDARFLAYTATGIDRQAPLAFHYFHTENKNLGLAAELNLGEPLAEAQAGRTYFPGELALIGGVAHQALQRTLSNVPQNWVAVPNHGYWNPVHRTLTGKLLRWHFAAAPIGIVKRQVRFELRNSDGVLVKQFEREIGKAEQELLLDFTRQDLTGANGLPVHLPNGRYTLQVEEDGTPMEYVLYLHDAVAPGNPVVSRRDVVTAMPGGLLGMVDIQLYGAQLNDATVLDSEGLIRQLSLPNGQPSHPIYEIRCLNRSLWWRYRSDRGLTLQAQGIAAAHFTQEGADLISNVPHRLHAQQLQIAPGLNIPAPRPDQLRLDPPNRLLAEVMVPRIRNLIETT